jgi:geranylgeranyl diphosphate synthase type I
VKPILGYNAAIRAELEAFIRARRSDAGPDLPWTDDLLERLLPFATTGKLLRGSLVCFSYEAFSGKPPGKDVIEAAAALELTHSALLIHDDIMDNDALRRGKPSLHRQYEILAGKETLAEPDRFGTSMAMCAGDTALFMAFEILAGSSAEQPVRGNVQRLFNEQLVRTCAGQMQDIYLEARPDMPSKKAIYELMKHKTASYTLALPLAMGAALAEQPEAIIRRLQAIGTDAGVIFQIRDDELGVLGETCKTGKPVGADIIEGKKTLLYYHLLKRCDAAERQKAKAIFGNPAASRDDIRYVQKLVRARGVTSLLDSEISRLEARASTRIGQLRLPEKTKDTFMELVRFCGSRVS